MDFTEPRQNYFNINKLKVYLQKLIILVKVTRANILSGFKKIGIVSYNKKVFNEIEFAPSMVTDQLLPLTQSMEKEDSGPNKNNENIENTVSHVSECEPVVGPSQVVSRPTYDLSLDLDSPARVYET